MSNFLDLDLIQFLSPGTLSNLSSGNSWSYSQGFRDTSLTVWDVSTILRNYEVRTGHVLSREELYSGCLANKLWPHHLSKWIFIPFTSTNRLQQSREQQFQGFCSCASTTSWFPPFQLWCTSFPYFLRGFCAHYQLSPDNHLNNVATSMGLWDGAPSPIPIDGNRC